MPTTLLLLASVFVTHATTKVRPTDPAGTTTSIAIAAAKNEFEAFQVVVHGPATGVRMTVSLPGFQTWTYRESLLTLAEKSNPSGATGSWPDALVPDRDEIYGETRNAFPFDVPSGQNRAVWIDVLVPTAAAAGTYHGTVHVTATGFAQDLPITLTVWDFTLPSTASLGSAFDMGWDDVCVAHYGQACDDPGTETSHFLYAAFALDHRLTLGDMVYYGPLATSAGYDWATWDAKYSPFLDGHANTRLVGAKVTAMQYVWAIDSAHYRAWAQHFRAKGWFDRTYDYSCDEPPAGCSWSQITARAAVVHAGDPGFRTMVTTTLGEATQNHVSGVIDILTPIVDLLYTARATYNSWLTGSAQRKLWWYFSCEPASSCVDGTVGGRGNWPNYVVDAPAIENRIMGWLSWRYGITTELYYDTTWMYTAGNPWSSLYAWGNNGDGTLFYPGKPSLIGGTHDIPLASIRLKMIREGREDYEYLKMLSDLGDAPLAATLAQQVAASASTFTEDPAVLYSTRAQAANRIVQLRHAASAKLAK